MSSRAILIKRAVACTVTALVFILIYVSMARLSIPKRELGTIEVMDIYAQKERTVDLVILGSSTAGMDYDLATMWNEYGISAYCPWGTEQAMWASYYNLMEVLKYQEPQMVVFECGSVYHYADYQEPEKQARNVSGMRFSLNKINAVINCSPFELWDDMLLELPLFHDRLPELTKIDYMYALGHGNINNKGFIPLGTGYKGEVHDFHTRLCTEMEPLSVKTEKYLRMIIEECNRRNICLILTINPSPFEYKDPQFNSVRKIATEYGTPLIDYNNSEFDIGITAQDFFDDSHLNANGARKLTRSFCKEIRKYADLPDHRGDPDYVSWDAAAAASNAQILNNIKFYDEYMTELDLGRFAVFLADYSDEEESFKFRDYACKDGWTVVGSGAQNHMYEYNGHLFTADLQSEDFKFIRYDGDLLLTLSRHAKVLIVYDQYLDKIVDKVICYYDGNEKKVLEGFEGDNTRGYIRN